MHQTIVPARCERRGLTQRSVIPLSTSNDTSSIQLSLFDGAVEIPLTQNQVALVDFCDADCLDARWYAHAHRQTFYALRSFPTNKVTRMHRLIMARKLGRELLLTEFVDHIDGNGLNNRRSNLRLVTNAQNQQNSRMRIDNASGYKGVSLDVRRGRWRACIRIDRKNLHLGMFDTPELAHEAYCEAAIKYHGEFARLK